MTGDVLEHQLLAAPVFSCFPSKNCHVWLVYFQKAFFSQFYRLRVGMCSSRKKESSEEVSVSSALALCPAVEGQCHDGGMYSQSQLVDWNQELTAMFFVFPSRHRRGPKTQH